MPEVNIAELEKEATKKKNEKSEIITKTVDGKNYFQGKVIGTWFDSYDECVNANQNAKRVSEYKSQGLNEHGQSPEDEAYAKKRKALIEKRNDILKQVSEIDKEIAGLKRETLEEKKEVKKKK